MNDSVHQYNSTLAECRRPEVPIATTVSKYLVPILVSIGVIGNSVILIVLNSKRTMRTKTNAILSLMAFSDLVHAIVTLFYRLQMYPLGIDFSHIYLRVHVPLIAALRWSGMTSNWFGVSVTVERLIAIRTPLSTITRNKSITKLALVTFLVSAIVCAQPMSCWSSVREVQCHGILYFYDAPDDDYWYFCCLVWEQISAYCYIVIPVIMMFVCNAALIYFMHRQSSAMKRFNSRRVEKYNRSKGRNSSERVDSIVNGGNEEVIAIVRDNRRCVQPAAKPSKEMQSAVVVLALCLTSACMSLPSAVGATYYFVAWILQALPQDETQSWYANYMEISNLLFLVEKDLAVFVYCITSQKFRRRLLSVMKRKRKRPNMDCYISLASAPANKQ